MPRWVANNPALCGPLVSVGSIGTAYGNGIISTNLTLPCPSLPLLLLTSSMGPPMAYSAATHAGTAGLVVGLLAAAVHALF